MAIKSSQTLVSEALSEVKTITADEVLKLLSEDKCTLIDIREKGELDKTGRVENFESYTSWNVRVLVRSRWPLF